MVMTTCSSDKTDSSVLDALEFFIFHNFTQDCREHWQTPSLFDNSYILPREKGRMG